MNNEMLPPSASGVRMLIYLISPFCPVSLASVCGGGRRGQTLCHLEAVRSMQ